MVISSNIRQADPYTKNYIYGNSTSHMWYSTLDSEMLRE
jgi:hypothetical protein